MRHRLLLTGPEGSGKSQAIVDLAKLLSHREVYAFDAQESIAPLLGEELPNLHIWLPEGEPAEAFEAYRAEVKEVRAKAKGGDWICFDPADDWEELARQAYAETHFSQDWGDYVESKVKGGKLPFGGFEVGDWQAIRAKTYGTIVQTMGASCRANVLVTAHLKDVVSWMKDGVQVFQSPKLPDAFKRAGVSPGGEAAIVGRCDIVLQLDHPTSKKWRIRTLGKGRGVAGQTVEFDWLDITDEDLSVFGVYCDQRGLEPKEE